MTVSISTKHDLQKTDSNDNETCCNNKGCRKWVELQFDGGIGSLRKRKSCDHTESLLDDFSNEVSEIRDEKRHISMEPCDVIYYEKHKELLDFESAPVYLKHNSYIRTGYRGHLNTNLCFESIFWWTNETINIWSHIFGFVLFLALSLRDYMEIDIYAHAGDKVIVIFVLICFQVCMFLSAMYHTFSCKSERTCDLFLSIDLFGIALSLLAIYTSGIYYAFWCDQEMQYFYLITVTIIFIIAMILQVPRFKVDSNVKMIVFVAWAAYGVVPTLHWVVFYGGLKNPIVALFLPRVFGMYVISGIAFLIYLTKIPERFYSGKFDYLGHSHQWWHFLVLFALYFWHNSGMIYLEYRYNHACPSQITII